jgi:HEPN domain-containing protein
MRLDPQRLADTRAWLRRAHHDLLAAKLLLNAARPLPDVAVFHCQQAAEKALKAFLFWHDVRFGKTHELAELGRACCNLDGALAGVIDRAVDLTPYAWRFRYPGETEPPSREDAETALKLAREVFETVLARLPAKARP